MSEGRRATGQHEWILTLLWSYVAIGQGASVLIQEKLMNVAVFVPIGFLSGVILKGWPWWKVMIPCLCISLAIELLQLILMRGFCETDDVIHNVLGALIGYGVGRLFKR